MLCRQVVLIIRDSWGCKNERKCAPAAFPLLCLALLPEGIDFSEKAVLGDPQCGLLARLSERGYHTINSRTKLLLHFKADFK